MFKISLTYDDFKKSKISEGNISAAKRGIKCLAKDRVHKS